jgi:hypothetical protein
MIPRPPRLENPYTNMPPNRLAAAAAVLEHRHLNQLDSEFKLVTEVAEASVNLNGWADSDRNCTWN